MSSRVKNTAKMYAERRDEIDALRRREKLARQRRKLRRGRDRSQESEIPASLGIRQLRKLGSKAKVKGAHRMTKAELIDALGSDDG